MQEATHRQDVAPISFDRPCLIENKSVITVKGGDVGG